MILTAVVRDTNDQTIGTITLQEKQFKTGSKGFWAQDKVTINGKRYQAQVQLVLIKGQEEGEAGEKKNAGAAQK